MKTAAIGTLCGFLALYAALPASAQRAASAPKNPQNPNVRRLEFTAENTTGDKGVWTLTNYQVERFKNGSCIGLKGYQASKHTEAAVSGSATTVFAGPEGYYTLTAEYVDEPDGASRMTMSVDGKEVSVWTADGIFVEYTRREVVPHVRLTAGAKITLSGTSSHTEYARFRALEITPGAPPAPAKTLPVQSPKYSSDLVRLGDYARFSDREETFPTLSERWPADGRTPLQPTPYYFRAAAGEVFRCEVTAGARATEEQPYAWRIGRWPGEATAESGKLMIAPGDTAALQFTVPEEGVYELSVGGSVRGVTHGLTRRQGFRGTGSWFFFVPPGTLAFRVEASALGRRRTAAAVKDGDGRIVWRGEIENAGRQEIAVPPEQAGKAWFITYSTIEPTVRIEGVPPWCALTPADLLTPRECLGAATPPPASGGGARRETPATARPLAATAASAKDRPRVVLTRNGQPAGTIVVGATPAAPVIQAADTLRQYLQAISGASLPLAEKPPAQGAAIRLGVAADFPELKLPREFEALNPQGFLIRTEGNALFLVGRTAEALPFAAWTFLRQLGCRWYFPGANWQVLPRTPEVVVALDVMTEPAFLSRSIGYGSTPGGGLTGQFESWRRANRMGGIRGNIHHSYGAFVPVALFKDHPEYFAMRDAGKAGLQRTSAQPCTTHPEVVKLFIAGALAAFEKNPSLDLLSVSPNDGTPNMCRCERCAATGTYSDCAWLIAHQVAEEVRKKYPGKWIGFYAYGKTSPPPTLKVPADPSLIVQVATAYNAVPVEEMLKGWPKYVGGIGVREYFAIPQWGANTPGGALTVAKARRVIPWYQESRAVMINGEACAAWGSAGLGMYVAAQLMWDTRSDVNALLEEFYADCFGAAAPAMKSYYERWDREKFNRRTLKLALGDLKQALAAADSLAARKRVAMLAMYLHALKLYDDFADAGKDDEERVEAIEAGDTFLWRVKDLGLMHFAGHVWGVQRSAWPWFTLSEAAQIIEEDLKALANVDAVDVETEFSWDLVPAPTTPGVATGRTAAPTGFGQAYWILSFDRPGTITLEGSGKEGKLTAQLFRIGGSSPLDSRELALGTTPARLQLAAPEKGAYGLRVTVPKDALYRVVEPTRASLYVPRDPRRSQQLHLPVIVEGLHFYVPAETRAFVVGVRTLAGRETRVTLSNARGVAVLNYTTTGGEQTVHVPPGADGQTWKVSLHGAGAAVPTLYLLGVPPLASLEPGALLTPRECVQRREE